MTIFKEGITVKEVIKLLKKLPQDLPFIVSSDEELNTLFKGVYFEQYEDCVLVAGLSGCEFD